MDCDASASVTVRVPEALVVTSSRTVAAAVPVMVGVGGTFGALITGVFATVGATGLLSGNVSQFVTQVIGVVAAGAYAFIVTLIIAFILDKTIGLRVEKEDEIMGLDQTQHSESAYN